MPGKGDSGRKGKGDESLWAPRPEGYSQTPAGEKREGPLPWMGGMRWEAPQASRTWGF